MEEDFENNNAYVLLKEDIDPSTIGRVLGAGAQSIIIKPYNEFQVDGLKLNNPVLVITKEKDKYTFLKKLFKKNVKKLNTNKFDSDIKYFLEYLKSNDWYLFYIEKMDKPEISNKVINSIKNAFYNLQKDLNFVTLNKNNFYYYLENIKTYFEKYNVKEKGFYLSIKKAFTALKNTNIKTEFQIDLHMGQFLKFEGKLVCVDPVYFNFK